MFDKKNWEKRAEWGLFQAGGGWCAAAWTPLGLSALVLPRKNEAMALWKIQEYLPPLSVGFWERKRERVPGNIQRLIRLALRGKPFRFRRFDISFLTSFQQKILKATGEIPWGQTRSYGWVARKAGSPWGFRAAGQALTRNPVSVLIPCHRVIARANRLGGYGGGLDWKIRLLNNEGVTVIGGLVTSYRQEKL